MPLILTRSVTSSRSVDHLRKRKSKGGVAVTGMVIFNLGGTSTAYRTNSREKYTIATDSIVPVQSCLNLSAYQSAVSTNYMGILAIGYNGADSEIREKYIYSTDASVSTTAASFKCPCGASIGNATSGIFHLGWVQSTYSDKREEFKYATETNITSLAATIASYSGAGFGKSDLGIFVCGGISTASSTTTTNKYIYATGSTVASNAVGPVLSLASGFGAASGNATNGVVYVGAGTTGVSSYSHATGVFTTTASITQLKLSNGSAGGNDTLSVVSHGGTSLSSASKLHSKHNYATKAVTAGAQSTTGSWYGSAFSGGITGVNM